MSKSDFHDLRSTEQRNRNTERIDVASSLEIVDLMNAEDASIAGIVSGERERIAKGIDLLVQAFRGGGRLVYVGAGASGRLGVPDAPGSPPTFGTPPAPGGGVNPGGYGALGEGVQGGAD